MMAYILAISYVLGVCAAVSVAVYVTGNPWCLLGLLFASFSITVSKPGKKREER